LKAGSGVFTLKKGVVISNVRDGNDQYFFTTFTFSEVLQAYSDHQGTGGTTVFEVPKDDFGIAVQKSRNCVIDALNYINTSNALSSTNYFNSELSKIEDYDKTVLVTCHRRENQGENLKQIIKAIGRLADDNRDIIFTWAIHPNPNVKNIVLSSELKDKVNVLLLPPLQYLDLVKIMEKAVCIISDSGGIQEEAPSFKSPVIVLREKTERPEGVNQGIAFLVGASYDKIIQKFQEVINHEFSFEEGNPYGDGLASKRVVDTLLALA
jgi:UDP-N-acetylglucosamine 2-epimerase